MVLRLSRSVDHQALCIDQVEFYNKGGRANAQLDPEIRPLHLTMPEKAALASFLRALNGTVRDGL